MKNIIFDWSGVVRDTVTSQLWIVNYIFEKYGVSPIPLDEFRENWEQPYTLFYQKYLSKDYNESMRRELYREASFHPDCPKSTAYTGMVEFVQKCKDRGMFLAIVSSDLSETLLPELKEWEIEHVFNQVVTDVDNKLNAVQDILAKNNLNLEETFFIGDSNHEIDVSKETGIKSVAVTWGFTSENKLSAKKPDYIAHDVEELESIIL